MPPAIIPLERCPCIEVRSSLINELYILPLWNLLGNRKDVACWEVGRTSCDRNTTFFVTALPDHSMGDRQLHRGDETYQNKHKLPTVLCGCVEVYK